MQLHEVAADKERAEKNANNVVTLVTRTPQQSVQ